MTLCKHGEESCAICAIQNLDQAVPSIHVYLILDVSPSMRPNWEQTVSGVNEYVDALRNDKEQTYKFSLITFSNQMEKVMDSVDPDSVPKYDTKTLQPYGYGTSVYDTVGQTIKSINTNDPVIIAVLTDGEDNNSHVYNENTLDTLLTERKNMGNYQVLYLGADKAAWSGAAKFASAGNTANFSAAQRGQLFNSLSRNVAAYSASVRSLRASGSSKKIASVSYFEDNESEDNKDQSGT